jgi:hypothetical protein
MIPTAFVIVYLAILGLSSYVFLQTGRFVKAHPTIDSETTLERFKDLARINMRLALVLLPLYGIGILLSMVLAFRHGLVGLLAVLGANGLLGMLGVLGMGVEKKARSLPASSEALRQEHQRVSESWVKKALPDF